jgi:hypothetical protein
MGHTEMLLAVAGLDRQQVAERVRRLAGGDWSSFSPAERAAYAYARKQARHPAAIAPADVRGLGLYFGKERVLQILWWTAQCHYQTSVADAFQLPLEQDNVFDGFAPARVSTQAP